MHTRLIELVDYLDNQQRDLKATFVSIPEDERQVPPGEGRWSAVDVLEHLALIERLMAGRFAAWIAEARARGVPAELDDSAILPSINTARTVDRSVRIVAPEPGRPTGRIAPDAAWQMFEDARAELKRVIATADGLALSEIVHPHRVLGPLTMYEWIAFAGSHTARHAAQIVEIGAALRLR